MSDSDGRSVPSSLTSPACSDWARSQHLDPVGTAGQYQGFLLVEQPLPWPFDVASLPELAEAAQIAASAGLRVQTVLPVDQEDVAVTGPATDAGAAGTSRRVICYRSLRPGWAGPLVRSERDVEPGALAAAVAELLSDPPTDEGSDQAGPKVIDVLVCTHGRRDSCCGGRGMDLVTRLSLSPFLTSHSGVRLWRTSHTGGHRFAPTSILLPSGTLWAWADPTLLQAAAMGEGEARRWTGRYRGCATLGTPQQQAVEAAVLAEVGWRLIGSWRRAVDVGDGVVRLESEWGDAWEAAVREGRRVPQPDCRTPPELAAKESTEWVVEGLRQVVPA
jgi:hypothetical protein